MYAFERVFSAFVVPGVAGPEGGVFDKRKKPNKRRFDVDFISAETIRR